MKVQSNGTDLGVLLRLRAEQRQLVREIAFELADRERKEKINDAVGELVASKSLLSKVGALIATTSSIVDRIERIELKRKEAARD